jgi:hypothetical protein
MLGRLNVAAIAFASLLLAHDGVTGGLARLPLPRFAAHALKAAGQASILPAGIARSVDLSALSRRRGAIAPYARGLVLALPILLAFVILMGSGDLLFQERLLALLRNDWWALALAQGARGLRTLAYGWVMCGLLALAIRRALLAHWAAAGDDVEPTATDEAIRMAGRRIGPTEAAVVVACVDALFAVFIALQLGYLFGGERHVRLGGYTYAQYARHGFFELLAVAALALALILGLRPLAQRRDQGAGRAFGLLASALGVGLLVVLASAGKRLLLYEEAYGMSELRLLSHSFMVALAPVCLWLVATLWRWRDRFAAGAALIAAAWLLGLNLLNPDAVIVRRNVAQMARTGHLDMAYLVRLSDDAVPALLASRSQLRAEDRALVDAAAARRRAELELPRYRGWPSWHLARWRVARSAGP